MSWHGQINRTIWEINQAIQKSPDQPRHRRELLRAQFLQHFERDKAFHVPRDDRTFLFLHEGESPLILLVHGASGTPAEFRELGNFLYARGISTYCPRLTRQTTRGEMVSWGSWVTQVQISLEAVTACSPNAFVCGLSMGGTVSMILHDRVPLSGMILLAPALYPYLNIKTRFLQLTRIITPTVFYHFAGWNGEVIQAMEHARKHSAPIDKPLLVLQASDDRHLSPKGLKFCKRQGRHQDCEIKLLPEGTHVLTRGPAKAEVFEAIAAFVERNSKTLAAVPNEAVEPPPISDPS
jgi:carboxylesterase